VDTVHHSLEIKEAKKYKHLIRNVYNVYFGIYF
jgi:hypothetical protein